MSIVAIGVCSAIFFSSQSYASDNECKDAKVIFARGSGGQVGQTDEFVKFRDGLKERLSLGDNAFYELGDGGRGGYQYPAVGIGDWSNGNLIGAAFSSGMANDYGHSVEEGVNELKAYLGNLHLDCPATKIVLGGYSQGAQVMGQSLDQLSPEIRSKVTFVALFGDPKLYLPEGGVQLAAPFDPPPACKNGRVASPWRRNIENCWIYHGALGARKPYLPQDMIQKVGAWCVTGDPICGSFENIHIPSYHDQYREADGPIDQATYEIAVRLDAEGMAANLLPDMGDSTAIPPDVIFVIDSEAATFRENHFKAVEQPLMVAIAEKVMSMGGGVGMNMYGRTCGNHLMGHISQPIEMFTEFYGYLGILPDYCTDELAWGGPTLDSTLYFTKSWFDWSQRNTQKLFVIISDSPYSELATLASYRQISQMADNFYIYPLVPQEARASYANLNIDGGQTVILDDYDIDKLINGHTLHPQVKPLFDSPDYKALPGQTITFGAEKSIMYDDEIVEYQWDFGDGDSSVSADPVVEHVYSTTFEGPVRLTVLTKSGLQKSATATVVVQEESFFLPPLDAPENLRVHSVSGGAHLTWAQNQQADRWLITINGIPLGYADKSTVLITDLERRHNNTFAVYGVTADGDTGDKAEVILRATTTGSSNLGIDIWSDIPDGSASEDTAVDVSNPYLSPVPQTTQKTALDVLGSMQFPRDTKVAVAGDNRSSVVWLWIALIVSGLIVGCVCILWRVKL